MTVREVVKALNNIPDIDLVMFTGYGFAPIGYSIDTMMKYIDSNEPIMDATFVHFEVRNNVATLEGCFEKYIKEVE